VTGGGGNKLERWAADWALVAVVLVGCARTCKEGPALLHKMPAHDLVETNREVTFEAQQRVQASLDDRHACPTSSDLRGFELDADVYGDRFDIRCSDGVAFVRSAGEDGKFGTADDIDGAMPWK
jgi:hypothetical protein